MYRAHRAKKFRDKVSLTQARGRGSEVDFDNKPVEREGSVMSVAVKNVVTIPPTMSIKSVADTMTKYRFRRIPITDPGTNRLLGMVGSSDIIDFLGGGKKVSIIVKKHRGNFLAAINEPVSAIMTKDVLKVRKEATADEALELIKKTRVGGVVIVDSCDRVAGIVTERDFALLLSGKMTGRKTADHMTKKVITATPATKLGDVVKIMVENSFRRLPVVSGNKVVGIVTTRTIIDFIGKNYVFSKILQNKIDEVLGIRCDEIMKTDVSTVTADADLGKVAGIMKESGEGTVCVLDGSKLAGIITERDVVLALSKPSAGKMA